jgi:hypothetical protein
MPFDNQLKEKLVSDWLTMARSPQESAEHERCFYTFDIAQGLCAGCPDEAWEFILTVLKNDPERSAVELLSAGPLEDLLTKHGAYIIERVENEARANPAFAWLLGGIWQHGMPDEIWRRVQAVWDRRGWDDVPKA